MFVNVTMDLIRKSLSVGKPLSSQWWIQIFQKANFHSKMEILLLAANIVNFLPSIDHFFYFRENVGKKNLFA